MLKSHLLFALLFVSIAQMWAQTDPKAGTWPTVFIPNGKAYRLAAPPKATETAAVVQAQSKLDSAMRAQIDHWNMGAPSFHWEEIMAQNWMGDALKNGLPAAMILSVATYDATVAAWDTKYAFNRPRPYAANKKIAALAPKTDSPSYPCEHSVAAGVGATIIGHFFPQLADSMQRLAQQQMAARVAAGMAYPSDTRAGFELGKKIAAAEIEQIKGYFNNAMWDGKIPEGADWKGQFAMLPHGGKSKTIALTNGSQFRPGPPPNYAKDMEELRAFEPNFDQKANLYKYSTESVPHDLLNLKLLQYNFHLDPPRAARAYALVAIAIYDSFVACWDAKYAYWGARPDHYDPSYKPLLPDLPFPAYPSGHACSSAAIAEVCGTLFPAERSAFESMAKNAAEARFQVGAHFRTDNDVALELGKKVGKEVAKKFGGK
jgi:membrane-associated phospholipid phosphatase